MPTFLFHTIEAREVRDDEGFDLPDIKAARRAATIFTGEMIREMGVAIFDHDLTVTVIDDQGDLCWNLHVTASEGPGARRKLRHDGS